jgi:hypothetical protein
MGHEWLASINRNLFLKPLNLRTVESSLRINLVCQARYLKYNSLVFSSSSSSSSSSSLSPSPSSSSSSFAIVRAYDRAYHQYNI